MQTVTLLIVMTVVGFLIGAFTMYHTMPRPAPLPANIDHIRELERKKNFALYERNVLVALLAKVILQYVPAASRFRVSIGKTPEFVHWETCVYIETPPLTGMGQLSWHLHDSHVWMVKDIKLPNAVKGWDGRDKRAKYEAISKWLAPAPRPPAR